MILTPWKVILWSNPPPFWNFLGLWPPPPHPPGISNSLRGGGLDIFWNHTLLTPQVFQNYFKVERSQYCVVCPRLSGSGAKEKNIVMEKKGGASRRVLYLTPQCPSPTFIFHLCPLEQLQSATKLVETLCPRGLSDVLPTDKGENKAFPPHPLQAIMCHCSS